MLMNMGHYFDTKKDIFFGLDQIKKTNMSYLFYDCESLKSLPDISKCNTSNVINLSHLFYKYWKLTSLPDISH